MKDGHLGLEDMPWGTYSSGLVTHCVKKNGLQDTAQPPSVFYPLRWKDAKLLYGPVENVEALLSSDTRAVHMWHSRLAGLRDAPPPAGSFIDKMCRRYGVEIDQ